jgi:hypothetical protein
MHINIPTCYGTLSSNALGVWLCWRFERYARKQDCGRVRDIIVVGTLPILKWSGAMVQTTRQMHLGVYVMGTGHHVAGWRLPEAQAGAENFPCCCVIAQTAERGKFDLFFLADALNTGPTVHPSIMVRLEPLTLLAALASCTSRIGLAATASTTYSEPYNLARALHPSITSAADALLGMW